MCFQAKRMKIQLSVCKEINVHVLLCTSAVLGKWEAAQQVSLSTFPTGQHSTGRKTQAELKFNRKHDKYV